MNNWRTILYFVVAFFFVLFSVLIGRFLLPFITWCTSVDVVIALSVITAFVSYFSSVCSAASWIRLRLLHVSTDSSRRGGSKRVSKVVVAIAVPILLSVGLNNLWFGLRTDYDLYAWDDYLIFDKGVFTKFGTKLIDDRGERTLAYTDWGDKVICCWDYYRDRDYESKYDYRFEWYCNIYDTDGTLLENFRGISYSEDYDPFYDIRTRVIEKLRSEDYVVPGY